MNTESPIPSIRLVKHRSFRLTPLRVRTIPEFRAILVSEVPADPRTFVLAFLSGAVLSVPIGMIFALTARPFMPPKWVEPIYLGVVLGAFVLLPFWSHFALKREPLLRSLGLGTFQVALIYLMIGLLLFPAV